MVEGLRDEQRRGDRRHQQRAAQARRDDAAVDHGVEQVRQYATTGDGGRDVTWDGEQREQRGGRPLEDAHQEVDVQLAERLDELTGLQVADGVLQDGREVRQVGLQDARRVLQCGAHLRPVLGPDVLQDVQQLLRVAQVGRDELAELGVDRRVAECLQ